MSEDGFLEAAMRMRDKLYHVAIAILWNEQDAADAVQDAMLKGWKHRGSLRDEAQFEVWFMRILVNQCRDLQRKQIRRRRLAEDVRREGRTSVRAESGGELLEAIRGLPEAQRLPVLLYYFDGYSQKEIGAILGCTAEKVKSRMRQARVKLREELERGEGTERGKGGKRRG